MSILPGIYASQISGHLSAVSFDSISTVTVSSSVSSVAFSGIPSTYKHLQVRMIHRTASSSADGDAFMRVGNSSIDSGSNYSTHQFVGDGSSASVGGWASTTSVMGYGAYNSTGANATAGMFATGIIDFLDYSATTKNKTFRMSTGREMNTTDGSSRVYFESGTWYNTAAITTIAFYPLTNTGAASTFTTGTQFALYGIKG